MFNWRDVLAQQERYQDLLRESSEDRLIRLPGTRHVKRNHFYSRFLSRLGQRLVAWGVYLQGRYNAEGRCAPALGSCKSRSMSNP